MPEVTFADPLVIQATEAVLAGKADLADKAGRAAVRDKLNGMEPEKREAFLSAMLADDPESYLELMDDGYTRPATKLLMPTVNPQDFKGMPKMKEGGNITGNTLKAIYQALGFPVKRVDRTKLDDGWFVYHDYADGSVAKGADWIPDDDGESMLRVALIQGKIRSSGKVNFSTQLLDTILETGNVDFTKPLPDASPNVVTIPNKGSKGVITFPAVLRLHNSPDSQTVNTKQEAARIIMKNDEDYKRFDPRGYSQLDKWDVTIGGLRMKAQAWIKYLVQQYPPMPTMAAARKDLTVQIENLIDKNGTDLGKYSTEELQLLRQYEGHGGLKQGGPQKYPEKGVRDQFYTPYDTASKMWGLAYQWGYNPGKPNRILEPACGIGRLLEYVPDNPDQIVDAYEVSRYAWSICKLTLPARFNFYNKSFETMFFRGNQRTGTSTVKYDLVIGNPPFKPYKSELSKIKGLNGKTEAEDTLAHSFDQYMLMRGVDVLVPGGLLVFIMPNTFMSNDGSFDDFKELLFSKADLLDAYRLPSVFEHTEIGTDLLVLKKRG